MSEVDRTGFSDDADLVDDEQGDFAEEHDDESFADNVPDGPERARESDQPKGLAGLD